MFSGQGNQHIIIRNKQEGKVVLSGTHYPKNVELYNGRRIPAEEQEANANLIAAAPDLYEVLSALFDVKVTHLSVDSLMRIQPRALEALAKARGEHD